MVMLFLCLELREEICNKIRNGVVDDYASKELEQLRKQIIKCEEQMKQKAEQILRSNKEYMTDNYCTFRNGRICLPVKKDYKAATELYPEDYDFSIIFETVENRKKRHDMQRKYTDAVIEVEE